MNFKLNCVPHLSLQQSVKQLFNRSYLSDVKIKVGKRSIPAHSLLLLLRSVIFEKELKNCSSEKKEIEINYKYESVLEFIRFVYTDDCDINDCNGMDLLQMAVKYQFTKLENRVINSLDSMNWIIQLFEHCVTGKYEKAREQSNDLFIINIAEFLENEGFLTLVPAAIKKVMETNYVGINVTEMQIFNGLAAWIKNYCVQNEISLQNGGERFNDMIKQIRFPVMSKTEYFECITKYPSLIQQQNEMCISEPRKIWEYRFEQRLYKRDKKFITKISVSNDIILTALWIGTDEFRREIEIEIIAIDLDTTEIETNSFILSPPKFWQPMLISIGETTHLKPNFEYKIIIRYLNIKEENIQVTCRTEQLQLIYKDHDNCIENIQASENVLEMIFKSCSAE